MLLIAACKPDDEELPPPQITGDFLGYATITEQVVCPSTVEYGEQWMKGVAAQLGIAETDILPTTYYLLDRDLVEQMCGGESACAWRDDDELMIFSTQYMNKHELVHAVHLSAWPMRATVLHEGLAEIFDDEYGYHILFASTPVTVDETIGSDGVPPDPRAYVIGAYLVYWMLQRHGLQAFFEFWDKTILPTTADQFRTTFELQFGESLDEMLASLDHQPACTIVTCVGEAVPWQDGQWSVGFTSACDDASERVASFGVDGGELSHHALVQIPESGNYEFSMSTGGVALTACGNRCIPTMEILGIEPVVINLDAGMYRLEAFTSGVTPIEHEITIRPAP